MNSAPSLFAKKPTFDSGQFVLVSYSTLWVDGKTKISDQFLWPKNQREVKQMKIFAIDFLSDILGQKNITKFLPSHITGKFITSNNFL